MKRLTKCHKPLEGGWGYFLAAHGNSVVKVKLDFEDEYVYTVMNHSNNIKLWHDVFQLWLPMVRAMDKLFMQKQCSIL